MITDVYRKDVIDRTHFPVFHQMDGISIFSKLQLQRENDSEQFFEIFERNCTRSEMKQACHSIEAVKTMEQHLKTCLEGLVKHLFGADVEWRWGGYDVYTTFAHPVWELELRHKNEWLECIGCGILEHKVLQNAGLQDKFAWSFGLGLERLAMILYNIPDIRLFWSRDERFLEQFQTNDYNQNVLFKPFNDYPLFEKTLSFYLPTDHPYFLSMLYDLVITIAGDFVAEVKKVYETINLDTNRQGHVYKISYRLNERALTENEVQEIHLELARQVQSKLGGTIC